MSLSNFERLKEGAALTTGAVQSAPSWLTLAGIRRHAAAVNALFGAQS